jgi:hypothetical protein
MTDDYAELLRRRALTYEAARPDALTGAVLRTEGPRAAPIRRYLVAAQR